MWLEKHQSRVCVHKDIIVGKNGNLVQSTGRCYDWHNPTVLSEHGERSDELHAWRVHRYEDHTVSVMSEEQM